MRRKCWCGQRLQENIHPSPVPESPNRAIQTWLCPDHEENWKARPCGRAQDGDYGYERICSAGGGFTMMATVAQARFCGSCTIPSEAVKARLWDACGELLVEAVKHAAACDKWDLPVVRRECQKAYGAALAAHAKAEKEAKP